MMEFVQWDDVHDRLASKALGFDFTSLPSFLFSPILCGSPYQVSYSAVSPFHIPSSRYWRVLRKKYVRGAALTGSAALDDVLP